MDRRDRPGDLAGRIPRSLHRSGRKARPLVSLVDRGHSA
ncbi:hypothetical protein STRTUCAR8_01068, partial [Streptomyces turgidiscabies Car8]